MTFESVVKSSLTDFFHSKLSLVEIFSSKAVLMQISVLQP